MGAGRGTLGVKTWALSAAATASVGVYLACAPPTQILLEVRSDACTGEPGQARLNATNIYVGNLQSIDQRPPSVARTGCDSDRVVGTLVVVPSGAKDDEVVLKVVGGVESQPDRCMPPEYKGCIVQTRIVRFEPRSTTNVAIQLSRACLNVTCAAGKTCDDGACVDVRDPSLPGDVLDAGPADVGNDASVQDATTREVVDASDAAVLDGGGGDAGDGLDASIDGGMPSRDAAVGGDGGTCEGCAGTCDGGTCVVTCTRATCQNGATLCAPSMPCAISCRREVDCPQATCNSSQLCVIACFEADKCQGLTCSAAPCIRLP